MSKQIIKCTECKTDYIFSEKDEDVINQIIRQCIECKNGYWCVNMYRPDGLDEYCKYCISMFNCKKHGDIDQKKYVKIS